HPPARRGGGGRGGGARGVLRTPLGIGQAVRLPNLQPAGALAAAPAHALGDLPATRRGVHARGRRAFFGQARFLRLSRRGLHGAHHGPRALPPGRAAGGRGDPVRLRGHGLPQADGSKHRRYAGRGGAGQAASRRSDPSPRPAGSAAGRGDGAGARSDARARLVQPLSAIRYRYGMNLSLEGKVAVVTGGSRGIGRAIARSLAAEGCSLGLVARGREGLEDVARELSSMGVPVEIGSSDVTDAEAQDRALARLAERIGGIDVAVANAGGSKPGNVFAPDEVWRPVWELNFLSAVRLFRAVVPHMEKRGGGPLLPAPPPSRPGRLWRAPLAAGPARLYRLHTASPGAGS